MDIKKNKVYTLDELLNMNNQISEHFNNIIARRNAIKEVRHKVVKSFKDFSKKDKELLLALKSEVFNGHDIYVFGSRVNGTYLDKSDVKKLSKKGILGVKESDWDIKSEYVPNMELLGKFCFKYGIRIDFSKGIQKIKI